MILNRKQIRAPYILYGYLFMYITTVSLIVFEIVLKNQALPNEKRSY